MIAKVVTFFKSWSKVIIGLLALVFFFIIMKKLGISLGGLLSLIRNFIKPTPKATPENPEVATKVSETVVADQVKIDQMQAQSLSEKTINGIDELLGEIERRK